MFYFGVFLGQIGRTAIHKAKQLLFIQHNSNEIEEIFGLHFFQCGRAQQGLHGFAVPVHQAINNLLFALKVVVQITGADIQLHGNIHRGNSIFALFVEQGECGGKDTFCGFTGHNALP